MGSGNLTLETRVTPSVIPSKLTQADKGYISQARYSHTVSCPLIALVALTKTTSLSQNQGSLPWGRGGGSVKKSKALRCELKACTLFPLWADMRQHFAIKPCLHLSGGPLVFHRKSKPLPTTSITLHVKVHAAKLLKHDTSIYVNLLWLLMQFIASGEAIARWHATETEHRPKILRQLRDGVGVI
jgi:hypothetical protein